MGLGEEGGRHVGYSCAGVGRCAAKDYGEAYCAAVMFC